MTKICNKTKEKAYNLSLGSILKQLRKDNNITQADAANYVDVKRVTISAYESGRIIPPIDKLIKFSKLYGVTQETLISLADNSEENEHFDIKIAASDSSYPASANELLSYYKLLSPDQQDAVFLLVKDLYREGKR